MCQAKGGECVSWERGARCAPVKGEEGSGWRGLWGRLTEPEDQVGTEVKGSWQTLRLLSPKSFLKYLLIYLAVLGLSCSTQGLQLQYVGLNSLASDRTWASALGAKSLSHWTTREVPIHTFVKKIHFLLPDIWVFTIPVLQQTLYISLLAHGSSEEKLLGQRTCTFVHFLGSHQSFPLCAVIHGNRREGRIYGHGCRYVDRHTGDLLKCSSDCFYFLSEVKSKVTCWDLQQMKSTEVWREMI